MDGPLNGRTPDFNPEVHPDIIKRGALLGYTEQSIAELLGIPATVLVEWARQHPEVEEAFMTARRADMDVYYTLYCLARGIDEDTGLATKKGPDRAACIAWLKARKIIVEDKKPADAPKSLAELLALLDDTERAMSGIRSALRMPAAAIPANANDDDDAGF